jgi:carbon storage regulator
MTHESKDGSWQVLHGPCLDKNRELKGIKMLVLTRKKSEAIRIGNDVFVKVIRTGRSTVKIGIDAPANVRVVRGELVITQGNETPERMGSVAVPSIADEETLEDVCSDQFPQPHIVSPTGV